MKKRKLPNILFPFVVDDRPRMKRFTPPRKLGSQSGSDYSDSEDSGSYYSGSSYT